MKNADKSAMPNQALGTDGLPTHEAEFGLTKREMMAMHMMQGLLSANATYGGKTDARDQMASDAVAHADALLAELDRTSK